MKMNLNKLIANDIVNYGMDKTSSFNYIVSLDSYIYDYKEFDMVFYWDNLMDSVDHYVMNLLKERKLEDYFELDDIKEIAGDLLDDESTRNLAIEKIKNSRAMEREI